MRATAIACWTFVLLVGAFNAAAAQAIAIDPEHSRILVHVSKAGLFSAFGDNHLVEAPIGEGTVDQSAGRVSLTVEAPQMKVLDPQMAPDKRREVQERMLGPEVLDVTRFPRITFASTAVEPQGPGRWLVRGQLSLHGISRPVVVNVARNNGRFTGTTAFKQRDFGIKPVTIAGGTVKVKDELKIDFDITTVNPPATPASR